MLLQAIETEVIEYVEAHQHEVDEQGRRRVVRNGYARERTVVTGVGTLRVKARRGSQTAASMNRAASFVLPPRSCRRI